MKAERVRRPFRPARLVAVVVAPLLALGAVAAPAQDRKAAVQVSDSDLSRCGASRGEKFTVKKACLRGRVRVVTTEDGAARAQDGALVEGPLYSVVRDTYDERGNLTLMEISDSGNGPGPLGVVFRRGVHSFDGRGRMTSAKWYEAGSDEPSSSVTYSYDERGNRVKIDSWRTKPDAHLIFETSYDAEGHEVGGKFSRLTPDGWQTTESKKVTTVEGGLTSVRSYSPDGKLTGRTEVLRDERGNTLSEAVYRTDARGEEQLYWKETHSYDRRGFLKEVVYHKADASLGARAVYEYDEYGNCTSLTRYNADGTFAAVERRYEYDAAGNWVAYVSFSRSSEHAAPAPYTLVRRQIEYY